MIPYLPHILPLSAIRSNWIIMDDKRTFLAIALAIAVLLAWTPLAEHMGWIQPQQRPAATQEATPAPAPAAQTAVAPASSLPVFTPSAGTDVKVETPLYSAVIYSGGGILRSFTLKHYDETIKADSPKVNLISPEASQTAPLGLTVNGQPSWSTGQWSFQGSDLNLKAGEQGSLTFTGIVDGVRVTRVISFNADNYLLSENILVGSADQAPRTVRLGFTVAATPFSNGKYDPTRLAWDANESFKEETSASTLAEKGIIEQGVFNWAGVMSNYFMNVTAPADPTKTGYTFAGWTPTIPATMPAENMTIKAQWRYNGGGSSGYSYYTIKTTAGAGGSISPTGSVSVREGRDQTFTITPDKGYAVSNVKIDGKSIGAVKSYTFENVSRTHTIEVIFMKANGNPRTGVFVDVATGSYYEDAVDCAVLFSLQETN